MWIFITSFWACKAGNASKDYEDAFWPRREGDHEGAKFNFAIADGATEGVLNGNWANTLVRTFGTYADMEFQGFLEKSYKRWNRWKKRYLIQREKDNKPIQWYEEPGLQAGAFSTFLGLTLYDTDNLHVKKWKASAIGDTCLFHIHGNDLVTRFPVNVSSDFTNHPMLLSSNPAKNMSISPKVLEGECWVDDTFFLMTDALACWFLQEYENGNQPWYALRDLKHDQKHDFEELIADLRDKKLMRNDDVTLVRIDILKA